MKLRGTFALGAIAVLALTGCSSIDEGYITEKNYTPEHYQTIYINQCVAYNAKGLCTQYIMVPQTTYYPPSWWFSLVEERKLMGEGEPKTGWVYVGHGTYDKYEVGDYYERPKAS